LVFSKSGVKSVFFTLHNVSCAKYTVFFLGIRRFLNSHNLTQMIANIIKNKCIISI